MKKNMTPAARPAKERVPPTNQESIQNRIASALMSLTASQRRMADFVRANLFRAATMRIDEFAKATGVSNASANRFARALGFDSYPQFRTSLMYEFEATLAPTERLRVSQNARATSHEVMVMSLENDIDNLQTTCRALTPEVCEQAVSALLKAKRIFTLGFGTSGYLASQLEYGLSPYCQAVRSLALIGGTTAAARQLYDLTPQDLVVAIAFPRYINDTILLAKFARQEGACVLALTDGPTSPLAPIADIALYLHTYRHLAANSDAAVLAVIQALCSAVAQRAPKAVPTTTKMTEATLPWLYHLSIDERSSSPHSSAAQRNLRPSTTS